MISKKNTIDLEYLEYLADTLSASGFHFNLWRTRSPHGHWECRLQPYRQDDYEHDWPFGADDNVKIAIKQAISSIPPALRPQIEI